MDVDTRATQAGPEDGRGGHPPATPVFCCVPLGEPRLAPGEAARAAGLFKALADPQRVRIVNLLATAGQPVCVCELVAALGVSQPTVSHHLKKLTAAGLLRRERRGVWAYYSVEPGAFARLAELVLLPSGVPGKEAIPDGSS